MKKLNFVCVLVSAFSVMQAQFDEPSINIIRVDAQKAKEMLFRAAPNAPNDSDFVIKNNKLLVKFWEGFKYWDQMFDGFKKNLIIFPNEMNPSVSDSVFIVENETNKFSFVNTQKGWMANYFSIIDDQITINQIRVGMSSKQFFKLLKLKIDKEVGDGQVWLLNPDRTHKLILIFAQDKIIEMQLY